MKINEGYRHIKVKLLSFNGNGLAKECYEFGRFGDDGYEKLPAEYNMRSGACCNFVHSVMAGRTFPKYALQGHRINFSVEGISRICLAQLTRDPAMFCSESHGLRPMSQELNIPLNMANDSDIMKPFIKAQKLLEKAYVIACEKELPYPETRYLLGHAQTISICCSYTPQDFVRACYSRTNNSFCDELNYVYRKMFYELNNAIEQVSDYNSYNLWKWLIREEKCIDDNYYTRTNVFNSDFIPATIQGDEVRPAQNDWRKSGWKLELERMYKHEPHLLTKNELAIIHEWQAVEFARELPTSYDAACERVAKNAIKDMDYYDEGK